MSANFPRSADTESTANDAAISGTDAKAEAKTSDKESNPLTAAQRLAESRERLRQYMMRGDGRHEARRRTAAAQAEGTRASTIDRLRSLPVVGVVIDAVSAWWTNHPLHSAASVAQTVAEDAVAPLTRRHPVAVLVGAFFVGGAIAWFKPWRLLGKSALFGGLVSQVASHALTQMPWESVLGAFTTFAHSRSGAADEPPQSDNAASATEASTANQSSARIYEFDEAA